LRHDIQPNERAFSTKEVAEELEVATTTVRRYGQILERNGYEFLKDRDRRIFVRSDIEAVKAIRDTDKPQDETAKDLVHQQKERIEGFIENKVAIPDTYNNSLNDSSQLKELLKVMANELATTNEMNTQLKEDMTQLKTTVSQLQQDHHVISSGVGNFSNKTHTKIEKVLEQQKSHYETLLEEEKQKSEFLQEEIRHMREEQQEVMRLQNEFNKRLDQTVKEPKGILEKLISLFRK